MPQEVQDKCRKIQAKVSAQLTGLTDDLNTEIQQFQTLGTKYKHFGMSLNNTIICYLSLIFLLDSGFGTKS